MSRVIVIHWELAGLKAAVLRLLSNRIDVEAVVALPLEGDEAAVGRKLANALELHAPSRTPAIVTIGRQSLAWQHLSLPPCPDEDLPDLVRLQSDYNTSGEDPAGLDFLPLVGDALTARRVWAISLNAAQLAKVRRILRASELKVEHVVPLALGWPAWTRYHGGGDKGRATIWVAPYGTEPTIWANVGERVTLFRQLQMPQGDAESLASVVAGELRRTLLAFGQEQPQAGEPLLRLVGDHTDGLQQLAGALSNNLQRPVEALAADSAESASSDEVSLPALGLAWEEAHGIAPLVDLVHPRRRPAPRTSRRTYLLASAAAASIALLMGWQAYSNLHAPLEAAEIAQAEVKVLAESSESLRVAEQRAGAIRGWHNGSVNLLEELEVLSTHIRPEPLQAKSFPVDTDVVIGKVVLQNRQFTIDALTKEARVVQPVETRLRDGIHRVQRGKTEPSQAVPGYPLAFQSIVDVTDGTPTPEAPRQ